MVEALKNLWRKLAGQPEPEQHGRAGNLPVKQFGHYHVPPLPAVIAERAVRAMVDLFKHEMSPEDLRKLRAEIENDPDEWWIRYHNGWGRAVRNYLRISGGIRDAKLPTGNWDDYYIDVIEEALRQT